MKIAYICDNIARPGGIERIWINRINYLADVLNYDVYLITVCQGNHPYIFPVSDKVHKIDLRIIIYSCYKHKHPLRELVWLYLNFCISQKLRRVVNEQKIDIVIGMTNTEERRYINMVKGNVKRILESHLARNFHFPITKESTLKNKLYSFVETFRVNSAVKKCDVLIALTQGDAKLWTEAKNVKVIPNFTFITGEKQKDECHKRIVSIGRLDQQKNHKDLIKAWKFVVQKHPDWHLDIFGDGCLYDELLKEIANNILRNITINPSTTNVVEEYLRSDFFVFPSKYEGFGLVLIEAMTCGLPCVSFDCPFGPADIIRDKEDGLLVENGNVEALVDAMNWMIEHEEERKEMGRKAKENVKRFNPDAVMAQWDKLYNELTKSES